MISAVIPTYNRAEFIQKSILSAKNQSIKVTEIIIVDDGSTDQTREVADRFKNDRSIQFIFLNENRGAQAARNAGIHAATSEWIAFLDSDDEWMPDRLENALKVAERTNAGVIYSNYIQRFTEDGQEQELVMNPCICEGNVTDRILAKSFVSFPGLLVKRDLLSTIGYLDESIVAWQEWETAIRLSLITDFAYVGIPAFYWNWHPGETISKSQVRDAVGVLQILVKHKGLFLQRNKKHLFVEHLKNALNKLPSINQIEIIALRKQILNLIYRYECSDDTLLHS